LALLTGSLMVLLTSVADAMALSAPEGTAEARSRFMLAGVGIIFSAVLDLTTFAMRHVRSAGRQAASRGVPDADGFWQCRARLPTRWEPLVWEWGDAALPPAFRGV
jgi:hypothetical protein